MPHVRINNKTLNYTDTGSGYPIVFAHSYLWDNRMWAAQVAELSKSYRCISIDMWAHGESDPIEEDVYTVEQLADDYAAALKEIGIAECHFMGLSVGGMIGAHLALKHPQLVKSLGLFGTYLGAEPEASKPQYEGLLNLFAAAGQFTPELVAQLAPFFFSPVTFEKKPHLAENFKANLAAVPAEKLPAVVALGRGILLHRTSILDQFPNITIPTMVVVGEDDMPRPPSEAKEMADLIPGATLHVIPEAGHISSVEQPEEITKLIADQVLSKIAA